jgi:hypothetical protein
LTIWLQKQLFNGDFGVSYLVKSTEDAAASKVGMGEKAENFLELIKE